MPTPASRPWLTSPRTDRRCGYVHQRRLPMRWQRRPLLHHRPGDRFENIGVMPISTPPPTATSSFEFVVEKNLTHIFAADRRRYSNRRRPVCPGNHGERAGHGNRDAYKNGNIVYLGPTLPYGTPPRAVSLSDIMLQDLESVAGLSPQTIGRGGIPMGIPPFPPLSPPRRPVLMGYHTQEDISCGRSADSISKPALRSASMLDSSALRRAGPLPVPRARKSLPTGPISSPAPPRCWAPFASVHTAPAPFFWSGAALRIRPAPSPVSVIGFCALESGVRHKGVYRISRNPMYVSYFSSF